MSMLDNRKIQILKEIMNSENGIRIESLQEKMKISRRTIYYDIKMINYWLGTNGLEGVNSSRKNGFTIDPEDYRKIDAILPAMNDYEYEPSIEERITLIIIFIACTNSKYGIHDISDITNVARSTSLKDLKKCSELLLKFEISLDYERNTGYYLTGNEVSIRKAIAYSISILLDSSYEYLLNHKLQKILDDHDMEISLNQSLDFFNKFLFKTESILERKFNDRMVRFMSYYFSLVIFRIKKDSTIEYSKEESLQVKPTKGYAAAQIARNTFEDYFGIHLSEYELVHIAIQLLCSSLDEYYVNQPNDISNKIKSEIIPELVNEFETIACVQFEDKTKLYENLYIHFLPAYYRAIYKIHIDNPLKDEILADFSELYSLTKSALRISERQLNINFNESETSYFAMHFASWFKKQGIDLNTKSIAIICPSGIATSNFIAKQIINLLPDECNVRIYSFREFKLKNPNVDLIISTAYLKNYKNAMRVTPVISNDDKKEILHRLGYKRKAFYKNEIVHDILNVVERHCKVQNMESLVKDLKDYFSDDLSFHEEVKYKPMLSELVIKEHVNLIEKVNNWKDAIRLASKPLLERKYISQEYIDAMIDTVINVGPYFIVAPRIAIPHARPEDGVSKLSMSLLKIDREVDFGNKKEHLVNLVIILAAEDNSSHLKALSQLTTLLSKSDDVESIMKAKSVNDILAVIKKY